MVRDKFIFAFFFKIIRYEGFDCIDVVEDGFQLQAAVNRWFAFELHFRKGRGSSLEVGYPGRVFFFLFKGFYHFLQQILQVRPRPRPFTPFSIRYFLKILVLDTV